MSKRFELEMGFTDPVTVDDLRELSPDVDVAIGWGGGVYTAAVLYPAGVTVGEIIGALGEWLADHPTVVLEEANVEAMG